MHPHEKASFLFSLFNEFFMLIKIFRYDIEYQYYLELVSNERFFDDESESESSDYLTPKG